MKFFTKQKKKPTKINMEPQKTLESQSNSEKKEETGDITLHDFKTCYKAIVTRQVLAVRTDTDTNGTKQGNKPAYLS